MAEVIHHTHDTNSSNNIGLVLGIIALLLVIAALFYFGLPNVIGGSDAGVTVNLPSSGNVTTQ